MMYYRHPQTFLTFIETDEDKYHVYLENNDNGLQKEIIIINEDNPENDTKTIRVPRSFAHFVTDNDIVDIAYQFLTKHTLRKHYVYVT